MVATMPAPKQQTVKQPMSKAGLHIMLSRRVYTRTQLHEYFGITDAEGDRSRVWRLSQLLAEMKEVKISHHIRTKEPIYSI